MVEYVDDLIASGGYISSSEVVREPLRLLRHERAVEQGKAVILRREVGIGPEQAQAQGFSARSVADIASMSTTASVPHIVWSTR